MKWFVHVHRQRLAKGEPPITIKKGKRGKSVYASEVAFSGVVKWCDLPCGARVAIECSEEPVVIR